MAPGSSTGTRDAVVLGSARSSVAPLAEFVQVAAEHGPDQVFPMAFPNTVVSVHVGYVATLLGITGPAVAVCGGHAGLEAVVEAVRCSPPVAPTVPSPLALSRGAPVLSGDPAAAEGAAAVRLSSVPRAPRASPRSPPAGPPRRTTGCRPDVRLASESMDADHFGAASGAALVAVAALATSSHGRPRTVAGPSGVRGVAAVQLDPV